jgi:hypothetical protein
MPNLLLNEFRDPHEVAFFYDGRATGHHDKHPPAAKDRTVIVGILGTEIFPIPPSLSFFFNIAASSELLRVRDKKISPMNSFIT